MSTDIAMGQAFDQAVNDLNNLISRRFAANRSIRIDATEDGRWIAVTSDGDTLFPACPHLDTVERFVRAFARKEGVAVDEESVSVAWSYVQVLNGFSVRVDALSERQGTETASSAQGESLGRMATGAVTPQRRPSRSESAPDNVVPIRAEA